MILDAKILIYGFLWRFWAARHFSRAKCAETNWDRKAANEIFSIERRFRRSKSLFSRSRKLAHEGIKERYPCKSWVIEWVSDLVLDLRVWVVCRHTDCWLNGPVGLIAINDHDKTDATIRKSRSRTNNRNGLYSLRECTFTKLKSSREVRF